MPKNTYSPELRQRAVRMVLERQAREGGPLSLSLRAISAQLGVWPGTLRVWCQRSKTAEPKPSYESLEEENLRLHQALDEAYQANEILQAASAFFASELGRPATK